MRILQFAKYKKLFTVDMQLSVVGVWSIEDAVDLAENGEAIGELVDRVTNGNKILILVLLLFNLNISTMIICTHRSDFGINI